MLAIHKLEWFKSICPLRSVTLQSTQPSMQEPFYGFEVRVIELISVAFFINRADWTAVGENQYDWFGDFISVEQLNDTQVRRATL